MECVLVVLVSLVAPMALPAAGGAMNSSSVTHQMWRKTRLGDHRPVEALVLRGNILITYD